ncbi:MAG: hypothetical protein GY856_36520 [bacterium]|nr:hypothetical protein [bacterium]
MKTIRLPGTTVARQLGGLLLLCLLAAACGGLGAAPMPEPWPPQVGRPYPDLELLDRHGESLRLSSFQGKVILVEPIGMNCPACNGFVGGNKPGVGGFNGMRPEKGAVSLHEMLHRRAPEVDLGDVGIVFVHLLLYDYQMGPPDPEDAWDWDAHFRVAEQDGLVVVPNRDLRGPAAYNLIPGFQLIDRDFVLRYDATGHNPRDSLWDELLPAIPHLLNPRVP